MAHGILHVRTAFVATGTIFFSLILSGCAEHTRYRFDPASLNDVHYLRKDCRREDDRTVCRKATMSFAAILPAGQGRADSVSHFIPVGQGAPDNSACMIRFSPKQCKLLPNRSGRYECKNVSWVCK